MPLFTYTTDIDCINNDEFYVECSNENTCYNTMNKFLENHGIPYLGKDNIEYLGTGQYPEVMCINAYTNNNMNTWLYSKCDINYIPFLRVEFNKPLNEIYLDHYDHDNYINCIHPNYFGIWSLLFNNTPVDILADAERIPDYPYPKILKDQAIKKCNRIIKEGVSDKDHNIANRLKNQKYISLQDIGVDIFRLDYMEIYGAITKEPLKFNELTRLDIMITTPTNSKGEIIYNIYKKY